MPQDAEVVIVGADGTEHVFPPGFDPKKAAKIVSGDSSQQSEQPIAQKAIGGGLVAAATSALPAAAHALEAFGTSPTAAKTVGSLARAGTTLGGIVHGVATGNAPEVIMSPIAGWQAGKGGYFLGKGAQAVARPVATALDRVAPYAKSLGALGAAQGVNDLAQMADPNRQDIGVFGVGRTAAIAPTLSAESLQDDLKSMRALMAGGKTEMQALKEVAAGNPQKWGRLMTLYIQSRQVK